MNTARTIGGYALWLCAPLLGAPAANAAWDFAPEFSIAAESDDNPRLIADDAAAALGQDDAATRLLAEARLQFVNNGERGELSFAPALRTDAYMDEADDDLQSTDGFLRATGQYRWERSLAGFGADFSNERILGSEFLTATPDDFDVVAPDPTDTALLGLNERRRRMIVSPYTEITTGGQHTVRVDARLQDVSYDGGVLTTRSDFTEGALGTQYVRRLDERSTLTGGAQVSRFEADRNGNETDTVGVELGFTRSLSALWSLNLSIGAQSSDATFIDVDGLLTTRAEDNATFGLGLRKRSELARLNVDVLRNVSPDSFGFLAVRNQIRLTMSRQMSPNLNGLLAVRAINTDGAGDDGARDRSFGRLELGLDWALAELWSLFVEYGYSTRQDEFTDRASVDARSNTFSLGFMYRGRARR